MWKCIINTMPILNNNNNTKRYRENDTHDENGEQLVPPTNNTSKRQKKDGTTIIMLLCTTMLVLGDSLMLSCMYLTMEDIINNSEHAMSRKVNTLREDWSAHNDRLSEQMFLLVLNEKGMF